MKGQKMNICGINSYQQKKQIQPSFKGLNFKLGEKLITKETKGTDYSFCKQVISTMLTDHPCLETSRDCFSRLNDAINIVSKSNSPTNLVVSLPAKVIKETIESANVKLSISSKLPTEELKKALEKVGKGDLVKHFNYFNSVNMPLTSVELLDYFTKMAQNSSEINKVIK